MTKITDGRHPTWPDAEIEKLEARNIKREQVEDTLRGRITELQKWNNETVQEARAGHCGQRNQMEITKRSYR
jgi:hypothetical protein